MREMPDYLAMLGRLGRDLPSFLRAPLTLGDARAVVRQRLASHEQQFLRQLDRCVFGTPRSPYRRLLAHAGCERGDVQTLVQREGVEGALRQLAERGVYITFDEFKGRRPIIRGSTRFICSDRDFDNPHQQTHYVMFTGGSRGQPTPVRRSLASADDLAMMFLLVLDAHGIRQPHHLYWVGAPLTWALVHLKLMQPIDGWYYPVQPMPLAARLVLRYVALLAWQAGRHMPSPANRALDQPDEIARLLAARAGRGRPIMVNTVVSSAVRVATAAQAMGARLDHVTFICRSEPLSPSRLRFLVAVGARALPEYATVELPFIAYGCPDGTASDDVHLCTDRYAVIERQRPLFDHGPPVDALLLTTLGDNAPKIALNVELGDSARIEQRDCGCSMGALGLRTHLSEIRSFEKLSTEGTSFARSNVVQILEEVLPSRFGGTPLDYQLVETEALDGTARLVLRVHPGLGRIDDAAVRETLLRELGRGNMVDAYQAELIEHAASLVIARLPPLPTRAGKVVPFHVAT